jgi:hypothetical protein
MDYGDGLLDGTYKFNEERRGEFCKAVNTMMTSSLFQEDCLVPMGS